MNTPLAQPSSPERRQYRTPWISDLLVTHRWFSQLRRYLGLDYWLLSAFLKQRVKRAVSIITDFEETLAYECGRQGFDGVVCGQSHHPQVRTIGEVEYSHCGDRVESCSALVEDQLGNSSIIHWLARQRREQQWLKAG